MLAKLRSWFSTNNKLSSMTSVRNGMAMPPVNNN